MEICFLFFMNYKDPNQCVIAPGKRDIWVHINVHSGNPVELPPSGRSCFECHNIHLYGKLSKISYLKVVCLLKKKRTSLWSCSACVQFDLCHCWSVWMADFESWGSRLNPTGGTVQLMYCIWLYRAFHYHPFHCLNMTKIILKRI